jgi:hypothetical protein
MVLTFGVPDSIIKNSISPKYSKLEKNGILKERPQ